MNSGVAWQVPGVVLYCSMAASLGRHCQAGLSLETFDLSMTVRVEYFDPPGSPPYTGQSAADRAKAVTSSKLMRNILIDPAAFHDEYDAADSRDVVQRIAFDGDEIGFEARRDGTDFLAEAERFGGERGGADDGLHWGHAGIAHAVDELFGIAAVSTGDGVRAEDDFHVVLAGVLYDCVERLQNVLHVLETGVIIVANAGEIGLVIEVVVEHQEVGVEVDAAVAEHVERRIVEERPVFDRGAAGLSGRHGARGGVGVDDGAQAQFLRF